MRFTKSNLLEDQIRVYLAEHIRRGYRDGSYAFWLKEFSKKYHGDANDITREDIEDFIIDISVLYHGQYSMNEAERAVRGLQRYYMARGRNVASPATLSYPSLMGEKKLRNRELVMMRLKNPEKWSWRALGEYFNIHFTTAKEIFEHAKAKQ